MKHFGWLRKAAASVLALAMFAAAPAALAYSDANLEAPHAKNVVIDGDPERVGHEPLPAH